MPDDPEKIGTDEEHWSLMTVSDESKEVVRLLAEMYANNQIHNGVGTLVDEDDGYAAFNNETLASYGYSYGYYTQFKKAVRFLDERASRRIVERYYLGHSTEG